MIIEKAIETYEKVGTLMRLRFDLDKHIKFKNECKDVCDIKDVKERHRYYMVYTKFGILDLNNDYILDGNSREDMLKMFHKINEEKISYLKSCIKEAEKEIENIQL